MESEEYNPANFGFIQFEPSGNNNENKNNQSNSSSTNFPLPVNAPQHNRNARGMDAGVQRIDYDIINKFQTSFADSLVIDKNLSTGFINFIAPVDKALDKSFIVQHSNNFDFEWHQQSLDYVEQLSPKDKYMLRAYTRNGDKLINTLIRIPNEFDSDQKVMDIVNRCIRNNANNVIAVQIFEDLGLDPNQFIEIRGRAQKPKINASGLMLLIDYTPDMEMNKIKEFIIKLATEIKRIIAAAPQLTRKIRVFRGIEYDYVNNANNVADNNMVLSGFQSTSYSISSALGFSGQYNEDNMQQHMMLYSILVHPSIPCIAVEDVSHFKEECEIILDMNLACAFDPNFVEKIQLTPANYNYYQLLNASTPHPTPSIYVKHMRIAPLLMGRNARANNSNGESVASNGNSRSNGSVSSQPTALSNVSAITNGTMTSANLNVAMYEQGFNGYGGYRSHKGGRTMVEANLNAQARTLKRNKRNLAKPFVILNNRKLAITAKNNKKNSASKMNNANKKNVNALMKQIEAIEAKENDYSKVRDRGLGFIIVKGAKVPAASKKLLDEMKKSEE